MAPKPTSRGYIQPTDDVAIIANNLNDIEKLILNTDHIANKYHIRFGKEKSKILKIGKDPTNNSENPKKLLKGDFELEYTEKYRYLG